MFTLEQIVKQLQWRAAGVGQKDANGKRSGEDGFDYTTIPIDMEYAERLRDGFDLVVENGAMRYKKGE